MIQKVENIIARQKPQVTIAKVMNGLKKSLKISIV